MTTWTVEPLWQFFAAHGIDPKTMTPTLDGSLTKAAWWAQQKAQTREQRLREKAVSGRAEPRAGQDKKTWKQLARQKTVVKYVG